MRRDGEQHQRDDDERHRVDRADAVEQVGHQAAQATAQSPSRRAMPMTRQQQPLAQHHAPHLAARRPEREADAQLAGPLADGVRHHAVDADRRQRERQAAEDGQQQGAHPRRPQRLIEDVRSS